MKDVNTQMLFLAFLLLVIVSCKEDEAPTKVKTRQEINEELLAGTDEKVWRFLSITFNGHETLPECAEDDDVIFRMNKTLAINNTTALCGTVNDHTTSSWSLMQNGTVLRFFAGNYNIVFLTQTSLKLEFIGGDDHSVYLLQKK